MPGCSSASEGMLYVSSCHAATRLFSSMRRVCLWHVHALNMGLLAHLDGVLLCWQAKGVPAHGVQHVESLHALVACHDVCGCVALWMADVKTSTAASVAKQTLPSPFVISHYKQIFASAIMWRAMTIARLEHRCVPGVWKHVQHVVLGLAGVDILRGAECLILLPILLPLALNVCERISSGLPGLVSCRARCGRWWSLS
jgi:hypothetical protein